MVLKAKPEMSFFGVSYLQSKHWKSPVLGNGQDLVSEFSHSSLGLTHGSMPARACPDWNAEGVCIEAPGMSDPLTSRFTSPVLSLCLH